MQVELGVVQGSCDIFRCALHVLESGATLKYSAPSSAIGPRSAHLCMRVLCTAISTPCTTQRLQSAVANAQTLAHLVT
jgi:hypothetical protein